MKMEMGTGGVGQRQTEEIVQIEVGTGGMGRRQRGECMN